MEKNLLDVINTKLETTPRFNTTNAWSAYRTAGKVGDDTVLLTMLEDVVDAIHLMERIYGAQMASLIVRGMLSDYQALLGMARARHIDYHLIAQL